MILPNSTASVRLSNGLLARKNETYDEWQQRTSLLLEKIEKFKLSDHISDCEKIAPEDHVEAACKILTHSFGLSPTWACVIYTARQMGWAHLGAFALALDHHEQFPFIQIHPRLYCASRWLFYKREEVIAHELIHLMRHDLDDGYYEEFLAYSIDYVAYRRVLGPLFSTPWSASLLTLSLGICLLCLFAGLWLQFTPTLLKVWRMPLTFISSLAACFFIYSLYHFVSGSFKWWRFNKKANQLDKKKKLAKRLAIRLARDDFEALSYLDRHQWRSYIQRLAAGPYRDCLLQAIDSEYVSNLD